MRREEYDALPVGSVCTVTSACPECGMRGGIDVMIVLIRDDGGLSGSQMKVPMHKGAVYHCRHCGARGPAAPKDQRPKS